LNTSYYIDKAIHAINTDQPNLAMLYMRRGIQESKKNNPNPMLDFQDTCQAFVDALRPLNQLFQEVAEILMKFGRDVQRVYDQEFYALVADNEG
jgi:hypothetical protein